MKRDQRILALILARAGSRRLPKKNKRLLGGKPLIVWSIESVKGIKAIASTLVSTDDPGLARIAKRAGALVPWLRPRSLAGPRSPSAEAALHALQWYETKVGKVDGVLLLQPTSPFRRKKSIRKAIWLFKKYQGLPVISVCPVNMTTSFLLPSGPRPIIANASPLKIFRPNGNIYLSSPKQLRTRRSFIGGKNVLLPMTSPKENIDIDTLSDLELSKKLLKGGRG